MIVWTVQPKTALNVFLIDRLETENFTRGMYVQATFWEIKKEYIKEIIY